MSIPDALHSSLTNADQLHLVSHFASLDHLHQSALLKQLLPLDFLQLDSLFSRSFHSSIPTPSPPSPLPSSIFASTIDSSPLLLKNWVGAGNQLLESSSVAVICLAGGQGTRLGSVLPKGCFDIGLVSKKSIFQLHAEKLVRLQQLTNSVIPFYVMTSPATRAYTESFFLSHSYFGLDSRNVLFFDQGSLPCFTVEGKLMLHDSHTIAVAPDGNGGLYRALLTSGVLQDMVARGIKHVHVFSVDNCLARPADPLFLGFASQKNAKIATKVVRKRDSQEPVGLVVSQDNRPAVVEYTEIDKTTANLKDSEGRLLFRAANIVNHYYSMAFLQSASLWIDSLSYHVAHKKIPFWDPQTGSQVIPTSPNGIKLEQFIFDVFPLVEMHEFACLEVDRSEEFSPLKNAKGTGEDDPDTCRADILLQGKRWVEKAGQSLSQGIEISPLQSYAGEGLENYQPCSI